MTNPEQIEDWDCVIMFKSNTASHDLWASFVDQIDMNLDDIISWLKSNYEAEFMIATGCWWIAFPDVQTRVAFEITWMMTAHEQAADFQP